MTTSAWPNVQIENLARPEVIKTELAQRIRSLRGDRRREDFCRDLGVSKETFGNYERGDRVPDSAFLALLREKLGVDLNWLCTGEPAVGPKVDDGRRPAAELEAELDRIEERFRREPEWPLSAERRLALAEVKTRLQETAVAAVAPDRTRARADALLRLAFDDPAARSRSSARERQSNFQQQSARQRVADAIALAGWEPDANLRMALFQMAWLHEVTTDSLTFLLHTLGGPSSASGEGRE